MIERPRRLRRTSALRDLVGETTLSPGHLIAPLFATAARAAPWPVPSMPGVSQWPVDALVPRAEALARLGIRAVVLFGVPVHKDAEGSAAWADDGVAQRAIRAVKAAVPDLVVIADTCLCEYTSHGHCGVWRNGVLLNDDSVDRLARVAVSQAAAGADLVAPSAMLDGMVAGIRSALDAAGFGDTPILSYSAKYASAFYGPFRDAAEGAPREGDRRGHQMDPRNGREAMREHRLDVEEGADLLMVKPALAYLDVLRATRDAFPGRPLVAYNVSGEYAMVKAAAAQGWVDERAVVLELLTGMRRAGADLIITYHAADAARWLATGPEAS